MLRSMAHLITVSHKVLLHQFSSFVRMLHSFKRLGRILAGLTQED